MNWRDRVAELRQSVWLALLDAREARDAEASERLKAWTDELDVLLHPPQYCERHELWWSGPYKNCPVCHMAQWYPEPEAILAPTGAPPPHPKPPTTCSEAGSTRALTDHHELLNTMDGGVWAKEFCRITGFADEGWALAWFCNAIMAGYDEATRRFDRDLAKAWSEGPR